MCAGEVISMPAVVKLGVGVDTLVNIATVAEISFDFVANAAYVVEVLADIRSDTILDGATGVGAEMNACSLTTAVTVLKFAAPTPLKQPFLSS